MPNWITNNVNVRGKEEVIKKFFKECFTGDCIDFNKIVPEPKTKKECPKRYICNCEEAHLEPVEGKEWFDWYSWHYDFWGVKWNACEGQKDIAGHWFYFESPWGSPYEIFKALKEKYPELTFDVDVDGEIDEPYSVTY